MLDSKLILVTGATGFVGRLLVPANKRESQNLMMGPITIHQKTIWMLQSFLKT